MFHRLTLALTLPLLTISCTRITSEANPDHCGVNGGDSYCSDLFPDKPYCIQGKGECAIGDHYGCVAEVTPECHAPCGLLEEGEMCAGSESSSTGSSSESGSNTSDTGTASSESSSTTGPIPCVSDDECTEPGAPFCGVMGECGACDGTADPDAACVSDDPGLPLCVGGACVQCTAAAPEACAGMTPLCDDATNTCVPCTEHGQCGEAACNLFTGACLPGDADAIAHVGPGQEFASLSLAVASVPAGAEGTVVVHQASYDEAVMVSGNRTVAFLAAAGDSPAWALIAGGGPQLAVAAGSTALLDGLRLSGNADDLGLRVTGGQVWADRSRIVDNNGGGIVAESNAELMLRNCFVGGDISDANALTVNGSTATVLYTTAGGGFGAATALTCDAPATVTVRNSLFVARTDSDEIVCDAAIERSAAELDLGGTNTGLGAMATAWFLGYGTGDFGLAVAHPATIDTAAQWHAGDPSTDIDGDLRPTVDGTPDYAGADVP